MQAFNKTLKQITFLIAGLMFINASYAIDEHYSSLPLQGNQIRKDSSRTVTDTVYFNPTLKPLQTSYQVRNLVTFKINEFANLVLPSNFGITIQFKVYYTRDNNGTAVQDSTSTITLAIGYNSAGNYDYSAIHTFLGGHSAQVKITNVTVNSGTLAQFENSLMVTNEIFVTREYSFSCTNNAVQTINRDVALVSTKGELKVFWDFERAADEYDLEWSYVDSAVLPNYLKTGSTTLYDPVKIFTNNATRVSIANEQYYIPLLYESKGHLFYRVRSVQVKGNGQRLESSWSSEYTNGLGKYDFDGHEETLNWQATTSFAEEGKRKSVVQYFDGSLRGRQTVTKDNTTDTTVVAETFYDHQGTPVIQVMASPSLSSMIKYTPNYNRAVNGAEYTKSLYDGLLTDSCFCTESAPPMDSLHGTSRYYSVENQNSAIGFHKYIPDAKRHPFSETRFLPDNTGRVSLQGGVGLEFQIGKRDTSKNTHETKYYYAGADQEELDALFGTEVGKASHYFKNMVRDANGQYIVSYVDMHGRTIATALAGKPTSMLDTLESNKTQTITKKLLDSSTNIIKDKTIESSKGLLVTKAGNHTFQYSLMPDSININDCTETTVCYDCQYDLEITITDDCNNATLPNGQPIVITATNLSFDTTCNANVAFPAINQVVYLREGSYLVTKKLTISQQAMDFYRDSVFLRRNTCKSLEDFILEQKQLLQALQCEPTCQTCLDSLGTWETFREKTLLQWGIPIADTALYRVQAQLAYSGMLQECNKLCDNTGMHETIREMMLADMSAPYGQYANLATDPATPPEQTANSPYSIFIPASAPPYKGVTTYVDENGNPEAAQNLDQVTFSQSFKPSWAEALLPKHPEYFKLKKFEELAASHIWDEKFEKTDTYADAIAKGYLNPGNFTTVPSGTIFQYNSTNRDPFFTDLITSSVVASSYKTLMQDSLTRKTVDDLNQPVSMWSLSTIMAHCPDGNITCYNSYKALNQAFNLDPSCGGELDYAWRYFRDMYLQEKRELTSKLLTAYHLQQAGARDLVQVAIAGHFLHFRDPNEASAGIDYSESNASSGVTQFIDDNCRAYAEQWWEELKPCDFDDVDKEAIINRLIQVCKEGGDAEHVFGSSTVNPSSSNTDRSFEDVIKDYAGANYNSKCNVYLITSPEPYDKQPVYFDKPVFQKPDSCECATIDYYYQKYLLAADTSFGAYIYRTTGTSIYDGVLDTLRMACNGQINCSFLKEFLVLPPVLQCGGTDICVDCEQVDSLYKEFKEEFPTVVPRRDDTDSLQHEYNLLFEKFMNTHLGFNKKTWEYLAFMDTCIITTDTVPVCNVALAFDGGTNKRRIKIPLNNSRLNLGTGNFTFEALIKPKSNSTPNQILSNRTWSSGALADGFGFMLLNNGRLLIQLEGCYNYMTVNSGGIDPFDGKAHHVAVTRDGDSLALYMDGVKIPYFLDCTNGTTKTPSQRNITTSGPLYIGYDTTGTGVFPIATFNGWIDEVRIWNIPRTQSELTNNIFTRLQPQAGLVGYYAINSEDTCEQIVTDYSTDNPTERNNGILGYNTGKESVDPVWLRAAQISYNSTDPVGVSNTCACTTSGPVGDTLTKWLGDWKKYGHVPRLDASGADTAMWKINSGGITYKLGIPLGEVFKNGIASLPSYYADTLSETYIDFDYRDSLCFDTTGWSFEARLQLADSNWIDNFYHANFWISFYGDNATAGKITLATSPVDGGGAAYCLGQNTPGGYCKPLAVPGVHYNDWRTLRVDFRGKNFKYYLDDTLLADTTMTHYYTSLRYFSIITWAKKAKIDHVKITNPKGGIIYFEGFDSAQNLSKPTEEARCTDCKTRFALYYNERNASSLTYNQIDSLYATRSIVLTACPDSKPMLCGGTEPVFPPITLKQRTACDDSTLFAVSVGTLLYEAYRDSLINSFNDKYIDTCLKARFRESFTVQMPVSEYHYTLYYYDQAGNLVKSVPPKGVNVSKFGWVSNWSDSVKASRNAKQLLTPAHALATNYRYNTLNAAVAQKSPDGGLSESWYDRLGRLAISRNAQQKAAGSSNDDNRLYSYTRYDILGRMTEVGQARNLTANGAMTDAISRNQTSLDNWLLALAARMGQITRTIYDLPYDGFSGVADKRLIVQQRNIRNRVSFVSFSDTSTTSAFNHAAFYTYDILGNVDTLLQDYGVSGSVPNLMNMNGNRWKKIVYRYDLIISKVNMMMYQRGWSDQFFHRYTYDAENRLTLAETSLDSLVWERDARYEYYKHGPLARMTLGEQMVQGVDYAYTLQGWLKGINSTGGTITHDMGGDGQSGGINQYTARDALGLTLNFFADEYKPINGSVNPFPPHNNATYQSSGYRPLYNGNISSMSVYNRKFESGVAGGAMVFYNYKHDQLNRLTAMDAWTGFNSGTNSWSSMSISTMMQERVAYDANGNITKYLRNGITASPITMDSLNYKYYAGTNRLQQVTDNVPANRYGANPWDMDIDNQTNTSNYVYDEIGNMLEDKAEQITNIKWSVYGKILEITRNSTGLVPITNIKYTYDAQGNRISKVFDLNGTKQYTWYVRDAQGNLLSTYTASGNATPLSSLVLSQSERMIYGSGRLGIYAFGSGVDGGPSDLQYYNTATFSRGWRQYELTNHLGNVLVMLSDKKFGVTSGGSLTYYEPDMLSGNDYYPFGMLSRIALTSAGTHYKYGFNGKENDWEAKAWMNQLDYGLRIYDPRIGRFLSIDPLTTEFPELTPYQFASNRPIVAIDLDGAESEDTNEKLKESDIPTEKHKSPGFFKIVFSLFLEEAHQVAAEGFAAEREKDENVVGVVTFDVDDQNTVAITYVKTTFIRVDPDGTNTDVEGVTAYYSVFSLSRMGLDMSATKKMIDMNETSFFSKDYDELFPNVIYLPLPGAGGGGKAGKIIKAGATMSKFGGLKQAAKYGVKAYDDLKKVLAGKALEAHHLFEKRFAKTLTLDAGKMAAIAVTKAEHIKFTTLWRAYIGYSNSGKALNTATATVAQIQAAARKIYKDYPEILKQLGL